MDVEWAFMVARGWVCCPFIDVSVSQGEQRRTLVTSMGFSRADAYEGA